VCGFAGQEKCFGTVDPSSIGVFEICCPELFPVYEGINNVNSVIVHGKGFRNAFAFYEYFSNIAGGKKRGKKKRLNKNNSAVINMAMTTGNLVLEGEALDECCVVGVTQRIQYNDRRFVRGIRSSSSSGEE